MKLTELKEAKHNERRTFDETKLKELAASIKEKGVLEPILVRPSDGKHEIVCGTRRFRAAGMAELLEIPVVVRNLNDKQALECQIIENLQREDVHPLEEAEGYEQLMKKHGYKDVKDIAAKIGKSPTYIYGRLKLCELIPENRKLFYEGRLSPSVALVVARVPAHMQKEAGAKVAHGRYSGDDPMTLKEAQEYIHEHFMLQLKEAQFDTKEKDLANKGSCAECLKRTGNQKELFPDVSGADICTDPGCFEAKKSAHAQYMIARLKEKGKNVVSQDEAKKLFKYENDESPESKYMNIDEKHYYGSKYMSIRDLLKGNKDAKITFAMQPYSGKIIEMVDNVALPGILRKAGIKTGGSGAPSRDLAKAKTENRVREAKRGFWINKVSVARDRRCMNVVILDILLEDLGVEEANEILKLKKSDRWTRTWDIPKLYELGGEVVQKFIVKVISKKSEYLCDDDLEFLSTKLGFNVAKDYTITEPYLQAMTKDQLVKLAKEIGLDKWLTQHTPTAITEQDLPGKKKIELIDFFMKKGFDLKDKIPKELAKK